MAEKAQSKVGRDFDEYAKRWADRDYKLELRNESADLFAKVDHVEVRVPGDEWGLQRDLLKTYEPILARYAPYSFSVLEIGAGAGRLTEILCSEYSNRINQYHTLDVSKEMTAVLRKRIGTGPVTLSHIIGGSEQLSNLPERFFDFVFSQSCWSHINLYDQYLYLRDLRRTIKQGGILVVNGIFMLGGQLDWTWNRFVRRVYQMEKQVQGVYHEVTSVSGLVEMALRLGWQVQVITPQAFILSFEQGDSELVFAKWSDVPSARKTIAVSDNLLQFVSGKSRVVSAQFGSS